MRTKLKKDKTEMKITELQDEYTDWLVENLPRDYVENEDCSAESILYESLEGGSLKLNESQRTWLHEFCVRWDKVEPSNVHYL